MVTANTRILEWLRARLAPLRDERGTSTLEWVAMAATVLTLVVAVIVSIDSSNGGPIPGSLSAQLDSLSIALENGSGGGGNPTFTQPSIGSAPAPPPLWLQSPQIDPPVVLAPRLLAPALGIPSVLLNPTLPTFQAPTTAGGMTSPATALVSLVGATTTTGAANPGTVTTGVTTGSAVAGNGPTGSQPLWQRLWGSVSSGTVSLFGSIRQGLSSLGTTIATWWNSSAANWAKGLLIGLAAAAVVILIVALAAKITVLVAAAALIGGAAAGIWYALNRVDGVLGTGDIVGTFTAGFLASALAAWAAWSLAGLAASQIGTGMGSAAAWRGALAAWARAGTITGAISALLDSLARFAGGDAITFGSVAQLFVVGFVLGAIEVGLAARFIRQLARPPAMSGWLARLSGWGQRMATGGPVARLGGRLAQWSAVAFHGLYASFFRLREIVRAFGRGVAFVALSGVMGILGSGALSTARGEPFGPIDILIAGITFGVAGLLAIRIGIALFGQQSARRVFGVTIGAEFFKGVITNMQALWESIRLRLPGTGGGTAPRSLPSAPPAAPAGPPTTLIPPPSRRGQRQPDG